MPTSISIRLPKAALLSALLLAAALGAAHPAQAQDAEQPLEIFGYFQVIYQGEHLNGLAAGGDNTSFTVQQLNLFLQKDLTPKLTALVDFELVNAYSSSRGWGAFGLEGAWLRYRHNRRLSVKAGLHIPPFGRLNEIKNRTPLLPYIIRPPVYEASFEELLDLNEFVPNRAYLQVYGFLPAGAAKLDYAVYLGNSANVARRSEGRVSGRDTTLYLLVGGRAGVRYGELQAGISATLDRVNTLARLEPLMGQSEGSLAGVRRVRAGADLAYVWGRVALEAEGLRVRYAESREALTIERDFAYGNLGVHASEKLFAYAGYWYVLEQIRGPNALNPSGRYTERSRLSGPTAGLSYTLSGRIAFKMQTTPVLVRDFATGLGVAEDGTVIAVTPTSASYRLVVVNAGVSVFF